MTAVPPDDTVPPGKAVPPDKKDQYELAVELFVSMASLPPDDPTREKITNSIIELCLPLATHVARRYQGRGQPFEDLEQVARVGLVQAVQRFDVDKGSDFLSFAVPTVMG
ncbi:sigma factor, partial [Rhodococcus erythropolis]|nr:sigma factor [Rhodococcus erythropolis]